MWLLSIYRYKIPKLPKRILIPTLNRAVSRLQEINSWPNNTNNVGPSAPFEVADGFEEKKF